jgi:glycosyltransferase involved in cell wall biosynthesis
MMRILAIHNYYQQRGGEDQCFEDEVNVLQSQGHDVHSLVVHNDSIEGRNRLAVAKQSIWNKASFDHVYSLTKEYKPDIVHVMNSFPLLSPSILFAAKKAGATVVHEVSNYRMFCANALMLRDGKVCDSCLGKRFALPAVLHRCYRDSLLGSATLAISSSMHRYWKTWEKAVDLFICPSSVARKILIQGGLPPERVEVKPNALNFDPGLGCGSTDAFVFVGRLSPEKGLRTLFEAWKSNPTFPKLKIIGEGPDAELVKQTAANDSRIQWLGKQTFERLLEIVGQSQALIMPSVWNETFGRTTIEAYAKGTPVIGSRIGGTVELIEEGQTGWLFEPGSSSDLAAKIRSCIQLDCQQRAHMRSAARTKFLQSYLPTNNYQSLMRCYALAKQIAQPYRSV